MRILVTGGAGYIGSHTVLALQAAGHTVTVLDDLSTGHAWAVGSAHLVRGSIHNTALLDEILREHRCDAVVHFAARIVVPESVTDPLGYYLTNVTGSVTLLAACVAAGVRQVVFSSSAAVYGAPEVVPVTEDAAIAPINPYGSTKAMTERVLADCAAAGLLRFVALRYFNVAGADPEGRIGQASPGATHLIKVACEAACGLREGMAIYGTDYPTPDGTCIRDYIHVSDLAQAHLAALNYLADGGESVALNCGYGHGYSVREVLDALDRLLPEPLRITEAPRRAGDPPMLVADTTRMRSLLDWRAGHDDLDFILRTALDWEHALVQRRGTPALNPQPVWASSIRA